MCTVMEYHIFTDGACKGNPGKGGWGCIVLDASTGEKLWELSGSDVYTTNNQMELNAPIHALERLIGMQKTGEIGMIKNITVFTDSTYVANGITKWIRAWRGNHWKTANGEPVKNEDLWKRLDKAATHFRNVLKWSWVKAHASNYWNNQVDQLASRMCYEAKATPRHSGGSRQHDVRGRVAETQQTQQIQNGLPDLLSGRGGVRQTKLTQFLK